MHRDRVYALLFLAVALLLAGLFFPFTGVGQIWIVVLFLCAGLWCGLSLIRVLPCAVVAGADALPEG